MSLHTKYRPAKWEEVLGQNRAVKSLKKAINDKRAKSFILTGPSGIGKTSLARIMASAVSEGKATAANIEEIDAATNSGADAMRALVNRTLYRAVGPSPVKAIICDEAHRLSAAAWTILLKPVEDPPKHVYWFFCSTEPGKIPQTIKTRCLSYTLHPVSEELILGLLCDVADAEKLEVSDEVLEAVAENAGGSPRQALVFLETCSRCGTAAEARMLMRSAVGSREAVDFARWLMSGRGQSWAEAMKYLKALEGQDAEGVRIVVVNYLNAVLMSTKSDAKCASLLGLLEAFSRPYNSSDKFAPLLLSVGFALGMDRHG